MDVTSERQGKRERETVISDREGERERRSSARIQDHVGSRGWSERKRGWETEKEKSERQTETKERERELKEVHQSGRMSVS